MRLFASFLFFLSFFMVPIFVVAQEVPETEVALPIVTRSRLNYKEEFIKTGFTFSLPNELFQLTIAPKAIKHQTNIEIREFASTGVTLPVTKAWLSKIYEYEVMDASSYNHKRRITFEIVTSEKIRGKVFSWDFVMKQWVPYPLFQVDPETKIFRGRAYASKLRLAVLQDHTEGGASWYKYKDCDCAASPDFPKGTQLKVTNIYNGKSVVVTVNDFGPERLIFPQRVIDLDVTAFKKIAKKGIGVIDVKVEPVLLPIEKQ